MIIWFVLFYLLNGTSTPYALFNTKISLIVIITKFLIFHFIFMTLFKII